MQRGGIFFYILLLQLICQPLQLLAMAGCRPAAMSNAFVAMYDLWAPFHNQAGLARISRPAAGIYTKSHFLLPGVRTSAAVAAIPFRTGVMGFITSQSGHPNFYERKAGIAYAMQLGTNISAGVQLTYLHYSIGKDMGSRGRMTGEAGLIAVVSTGLYLGAHVFNPANARLMPGDELFLAETLPSRFRTGISWLVSEQLCLSAEFFKDLRYRPRLKAGLEYQPVDQVYIRTGLATNPMVNSFGFGIRRNQIKIDLSTSLHAILGHSPSLSIQYEIK